MVVNSGKLLTLRVTANSAAAFFWARIDPNAPNAPNRVKQMPVRRIREQRATFRMKQNGQCEGQKTGFLPAVGHIDLQVGMCRLLLSTVKTRLHDGFLCLIISCRDIYESDF
jgi:hypothetical protein